MGRDGKEKDLEFLILRAETNKSLYLFIYEIVFCNWKFLFICLF